MRDICLLVKTGFLPFFGVTISGKKRGAFTSKRKAGMTLAVFGIMLLLMGSFALYEYQMIIALVMFGAQEALLPIIMVAACFISFFTTIFKAGSVLFAFKDYDLLVSLPVAKWKITASRVALLYLLDLFFTAVLMVPAGILHASFVSVQAWFYPMFFFTLLLVPVIPVSLASVVGTLVLAVSRKFKHRTVVNTVLSMVLLIGFMYLSFNSQQLISDFGSVGDQIMQGMLRVYPVAYFYHSAVIGGNLLSLLMFTAISAVLIWLVSALSARNMSALHEAFAVSTGMRKYRADMIKAATPFKALYKKELRRFFSSSLYMLNAGIGVVLYTAAAVALLIFGEEGINSYLQIPGASEHMVGFLPVVCCFFVVMTFPSACSISLEGKSIGILKSLPVRTGTVLWAKVAMNLTLTIPAVLLNGTLAVLALRPGIGYSLFFYLLPGAVAVLSAVMGVTINLALPSFDWSSEVAVIKQSASVLVATLAAFMVTGGAIAYAVTAQGTVSALAVITAAAAILAAGLSVFLRSWGAKRFVQIG